MVRLKDELLDDIEVDSTTFQFHYGSVKRGDRSNRWFPADVFQFHYGSVKSGIDSDTTEISSPFQFHYGSVKRLMPFALQIPDIYFNSTMVRLKVELESLEP